ncbi:GNAT family N-acetyltransferase [Oscillospiraceae bacterium MB08-C2-2]|nr:GNAT family N-acetyltransferase [Oscillospiraceae bacterium MB08-C2-2]
MKTPVLETERMLLRPLRQEDAQTVFERWSSDPAVARYMIWEQHQSVQDTLDWLKMEEANLESPTSYVWGFVLKEDGLLFGSGGLNFNENHGMFEIGYNIMQSRWNQGYTTEAARAMLDFAVLELKVDRIFGHHAKENPNSGKVMEKVGFVYQRDGQYVSFGGTRAFESREYLLTLPAPWQKDRT